MMIRTVNGVRVAVLDVADTLQSEQDALDLIAEIGYTYEMDRAVIPAEVLSPTFFDLRGGLAGGILQKFVNYGIRVAIVGDFSAYSSKALRDFMFESNKGGHVYFAATEEDALVRICT